MHLYRVYRDGQINHISKTKNRKHFFGVISFFLKRNASLRIIKSKRLFLRGGGVCRSLTRKKPFYVRFLVFELWSILYMGDFHVFDSLFIKIDHIQNLPYLKKLKVAQKKLVTKNRSQSNAHLFCTFGHI